MSRYKHIYASIAFDQALESLYDWVEVLWDSCRHDLSRLLARLHGYGGLPEASFLLFIMIPVSHILCLQQGVLTDILCAL